MQPKTADQVWSTYLVECGDGSIYCGVTNDVDRRMRDHASPRGAKYVRSHGGVRSLLRAIALPSKEAAMRVEFWMKRASRTRKAAIAAGAELPASWLQKRGKAPIASAAAGMMMIFALGMGGTPAAAQATAPVSSEMVSNAEVFIIDGDTISVHRERIRFLSIDAPETHEPRCEAELVAGLRAKEALRTMLVQARTIELRRSGRLDVYGRTLADVLVDGTEVGAKLEAVGLALPYRSGHAAKLARARHWCGDAVEMPPARQPFFRQ